MYGRYQGVGATLQQAGRLGAMASQQQQIQQQAATQAMHMQMLQMKFQSNLQKGQKQPPPVNLQANENDVKPEEKPTTAITLAPQTEIKKSPIVLKKEPITATPNRGNIKSRIEAPVSAPVKEEKLPVVLNRGNNATQQDQKVKPNITNGQPPQQFSSPPQLNHSGTNANPQIVPQKPIVSSSAPKPIVQQPTTYAQKAAVQPSTYSQKDPGQTPAYVQNQSHGFKDSPGYDKESAGSRDSRANINSQGLQQNRNTGMQSQNAHDQSQQHQARGGATNLGSYNRGGAANEGHLQSQPSRGSAGTVATNQVSPASRGPINQPQHKGSENQGYQGRPQDQRNTRFDADRNRNDRGNQGSYYNKNQDSRDQRNDAQSDVSGNLPSRLAQNQNDASLMGEPPAALMALQPGVPQSQGSYESPSKNIPSVGGQNQRSAPQNPRAAPTAQNQRADYSQSNYNASRALMDAGDSRGSRSDRGRGAPVPDRAAATDRRDASQRGHDARGGGDNWGQNGQWNDRWQEGQWQGHKDNRSQGYGQNRGGASDNYRGGQDNYRGGRPFYREDRIKERINQTLGGPQLDLEPLDMSEKKFNAYSRLFIGNLPKATVSEELEELFSKYGEIGQIYVHKEYSYAFITFDYKANASKAQKETDDQLFKNRAMKVRFATISEGIKVKNLSPYISNELLEKAFAAFGPVETVRVFVDERGISKGEGILIFREKRSAMTALNKCQDDCFFLSGSMRPIIASPLEYQEEQERGLPESSIPKNDEYRQERSVGPHFAEANSYEYEFALQWKKLFNAYEEKKNVLDHDFQVEVERMEKKMVLAKVECETDKLRRELAAREADAAQLRAHFGDAIDQPPPSQKMPGDPGYEPVYDPYTRYPQGPEFDRAAYDQYTRDYQATYGRDPYDRQQYDAQMNPQVARGELPHPQMPQQQIPAIGGGEMQQPQAARDMQGRDQRDMAPMRDIPQRDAQGRDIPQRDAQGRDIPARDAQGRDVPARDMQGRDMAPARDLQGRDIPQAQPREMDNRDLRSLAPARDSRDPIAATQMGHVQPGANAMQMSANDVSAGQAMPMELEGAGQARDALQQGHTLQSAALQPPAVMQHMDDRYPNPYQTTAAQMMYGRQTYGGGHDGRQDSPYEKQPIKRPRY